MEIYNITIEVVKGIEELYINSNKSLEGLIIDGREIINTRMDDYE